MSALGKKVFRVLERLGREAGALTFRKPVHTVYNPYDYAADAVRVYVERFVRARPRALFLGMNPGPWGMAQTGVPFGEVAAVRDWMGLAPRPRTPQRPHPARPVTGLACTRSEVSGRRFWGLMRERFGTPEAFFADHFVLNYCPLMFLAASGANMTPDKLPARERTPLMERCDAALSEVLQLLRPDRLVGVGGYAEEALRRCAPGAKVLRILHPSPASPAANRDWAGVVTRELTAAGLWKKSQAARVAD